MRRICEALRSGRRFFAGLKHPVTCAENAKKSNRSQARDDKGEGCALVWICRWITAGRHSTSLRPGSPLRFGRDDNSFVTRTFSLTPVHCSLNLPPQGRKSDAPEQPGKIRYRRSCRAHLPAIPDRHPKSATSCPGMRGNVECLACTHLCIILRWCEAGNWNSSGTKKKPEPTSPNMASRS